MLTFFFQGRWLGALQPELEALLHALLFGFSIFSNKPTYGLQLQNLMYRNEFAKNVAANEPPTLWQRVLFGVFLIGMQNAIC